MPPKRKAASKVQDAVSGNDGITIEVKDKNQSALDETQDNGRATKRARAQPKNAKTNATAKVRFYDGVDGQALAAGSHVEESAAPNSRGKTKTRAENKENPAVVPERVERAVESTSKPKRSAPKRGSQKTNNATKIIANDQIEDTTTTSTSLVNSIGNKTTSTAKGRRKVKPETDISIPDTQEMAGEVEESILEEGLPPQVLSLSPTKKSPHNTARGVRRGLQDLPSTRKSTTPSEAEGVLEDGDLKSQLDNITKEYAALESHYHDLKEIGINQANANMEKLQEHCQSITEGMSFFLHIYLCVQCSRRAVIDIAL